MTEKGTEEVIPLERLMASSVFLAVGGTSCGARSIEGSRGLQDWPFRSCSIGSGERFHGLASTHPSNPESSMPKKEVTSKSAAHSASKTLSSPSTAKASKSAAGSALSQRKAPEKTTSSASATAASKTLRDGRTSKDSKSAAGSALTQASARKTK